MALTLDGNGTMTVGNGDITGITRGAIESTAIGTGAVLQVVQGTTTSLTTTTSSSFVATNLSASITPSSTSSKVLIIVSTPLDNEASGNQGLLTIYRNDSVELFTNSSTGNGFGGIYAAGTRMVSVCSGAFLDSPNTTSSTTYKMYIRSATGSVRTPLSGTAVITLLEIAG